MYQKEFLEAENENCSELRDLELELNNMLAGIIQNGKAGGFFRNIDKDFAVSLILGSIYGAINRGIEKNYSEAEMINDRERIFDFVLHGLFSGFENFDPLPLKNKTIVITRTVDQSKESAEVFNRLGANVIIIPTLEIVSPDSWEEFDSVVKSKEQIDFIIFTSAHAVTMFKQRIEELGIKFNFNKVKSIAVGNKTKGVCEKNNLPVDIVPNNFSANGVIETLSSLDIKNKLIFIPRSAIGREELPEGLEKLGAKIKTAPVYNVAVPSAESINGQLEKLKSTKPDLFIFTSPSTFKNFLQIMNIPNPELYFKDLNIAAIGPTTKSAIEEKNVSVTIMPAEYTIDGLTKAIVSFYRNNKTLN